MTSDSVEEAKLEEARKVLARPSILCFLGFSFDRINLADRLGVPDVSAWARNTDRKTASVHRV